LAEGLVDAVARNLLAISLGRLEILEAVRFARRQEPIPIARSFAAYSFDESARERVIMDVDDWYSRHGFSLREQVTAEHAATLQ
jgi:hypothetical protein